MDDDKRGNVPQFATAEYSSKPDEVACKSCKQRITEAHYQINGVPVCTSCTQRIKDRLPKDSPAAFSRGVLFGVGAALLALALYAGFAIATGLVAGIVSLAVGYLVGKAIMMGSGGQGGRRYQIAAVLLTYFAVSVAAVPIAISQRMKHAGPQSAQAAGAPAADAPRTMGPLQAAGVLTMIGLVSPFLALADPMHGLIGLVILFVGLRIAWRITAGRQVTIVGPIDRPASTAAP